MEVPPHLLNVLLETMLLLFEPQQLFGLLFDRPGLGKDSSKLRLDSMWDWWYFSMIGASYFALFSRCLLMRARSLPSLGVFM